MHVKILGFGSLLSERSSRLTFPNLQDFHLVRVSNYRRVFAHPASIFFQRKIANLETLEFSSLSVEPCEGASFVASVFSVPNNDNNMLDANGVPSAAFREREEEYSIIPVSYQELAGGTTSSHDESTSTAIICTRSTDEAYLQQWGQERFDEYYAKYGIHTIWGWKPDSGLRPCAVYLRHCYLAAASMGKVCLDSFLDETFLVDRVTTIREYLEKNPHVMETRPPLELAERYGG